MLINNQTFSVCFQMCSENRFFKCLKFVYKKIKYFLNLFILSCGSVVNGCVYSPGNRKNGR